MCVCVELFIRDVEQINTKTVNTEASNESINCTKNINKLWSDRRDYFRTKKPISTAKHGDDIRCIRMLSPIPRIFCRKCWSHRSVAGACAEFYAKRKWNHRRCHRLDHPVFERQVSESICCFRSLFFSECIRICVRHWYYVIPWSRVVCEKEKKKMFKINIYAFP